MNRHHPVVWSEGLLLTPQHLQQADHALHHLISDRFRQAHAFEWGLTQIDIDREALRNGRVSVSAVRGVLPDGTPFAAPEDDGLPPARSLEGHFDGRAESLTVYVGLPTSRPGRPQLGMAREGHPTPRFAEESIELPDDNTGSDERAVSVARKNLVVLFPDDALGDHDHLPVAEVVRTSDGAYALRETYIPPSLALSASEPLTALVRNTLERLIAKSAEISGMRRQRGSVVDFSSADTTSFLQLYTVNRAIPPLAHCLAHKRAHPEDVYLALAGLAGALCTFSDRWSPKDLPAYDHRSLSQCIAGVHAVIGDLLEIKTQSKATRIDLEKKDGSVWVGRITDDRLLMPGAALYLGVKADVEEQRIVTEIPVKLKIASLDRIDFLIAMAIRGVPAVFERVPPATLPVKSQFLYFKLDSNHELWEGVKGAKNIALFVPPEYPGLTLELLGLRE
jgi:type VI secretion system protein ImpJ